MHIKVNYCVLNRSAGADTKKADNSFGKRLATTVVDNLQLYINRVHVRFEETQNRVSIKPVGCNSY